MTPAERTKAWREANPERAKETARRYREANRERNAARERERRAKEGDAIRGRSRARYAANREAYKARVKARRDGDKARVSEMERACRYGISVERLREVLAPGMCTVCGGTEWLVIDHEHRSGAVRGLLCHYCNSAIGLFREDPERLESAARYLRAAQA